MCHTLWSHAGQHINERRLIACSLYACMYYMYTPTEATTASVLRHSRPLLMCRRAYIPNSFNVQYVRRDKTSSSVGDRHPQDRGKSGHDTCERPVGCSTNWVKSWCLLPVASADGCKYGWKKRKQLYLTIMAEKLMCNFYFKTRCWLDYCFLLSLFSATHKKQVVLDFCPHFADRGIFFC